MDSVSIVKFTPGEEMLFSCQCNTDTPEWRVLLFDQDITYNVQSPVHCSHHGSPCNPPQTYIAPGNQTPGKYTYLNLSGSFNQTTLLQCTNRLDKTVQQFSILLLIDCEYNYDDTKKVGTLLICFSKIPQNYSNNNR